MRHRVCGPRPDAPSGSMAKPYRGLWGRCPRKLLHFREFIGLKTCLPRSHFYYISIIINGVKLIKHVLTEIYTVISPFKSNNKSKTLFFIFRRIPKMWLLLSFLSLSPPSQKKNNHYLNFDNFSWGAPPLYGYK
jgi:hypothetical protein